MAKKLLLQNILSSDWIDMSGWRAATTNKVSFELSIRNEISIYGEVEDPFPRALLLSLQKFYCSSNHTVGHYSQRHYLTS